MRANTSLLSARFEMSPRASYHEAETESKDNNPPGEHTAVKRDCAETVSHTIILRYPHTGHPKSKHKETLK